ncbi:MAG: hypothetical protein HYX53_11205 [Chloroflexi bacterium]|nr:hypothetical protein [Chloroflexota bacterium]
MALNAPITIHLAEETRARLELAAAERKAPLDEIVEQALAVYLADHLGASEWSELSTGALEAVWDNDLDARYDNWRELYGIPPG